MPLKLYRRGTVWHYRGTVAGRRIRGSTGTEKKERAQQIASAREEREWKSHHLGPEAVLTFADAAILYRQAQKPTRFLDAVEDYWRDMPVKSITDGLVRQASITQFPKAKPATRNRNFIVPTQSIINHAAELGHCAHLKVKRFPVVKVKKPYVTWEWLQGFMAHSSPHLGALAAFMLLTGARISEALRVTWDDVNLSIGRVRITGSRKGRGDVNDRVAHMPPFLVAAIANIPSNRNPDAQVFPYSSAHTAKWPWKDAYERAGLKRITFHGCRHGFATGLLHRGVDPITTAKLGGWKDAKHVFETYGHAMDDDTLANRIIDTPVTRDNVSGQISKSKQGAK